MVLSFILFGGERRRASTLMPLAVPPYICYYDESSLMLREVHRYGYKDRLLYSTSSSRAASRHLSPITGDRDLCSSQPPGAANVGARRGTECGRATSGSGAPSSAVAGLASGKRGGVQEGLTFRAQKERSKREVSTVTTGGPFY